MSSTLSPEAVYTARLEQARASGQRLWDLTESEPSRVGLGWDTPEIEAIVGAARAERASARSSLAAREAVASYLAGRGAAIAPDHVVMMPSPAAVLRALFEVLCTPGDEVLAATPARPWLQEFAAGRGAGLKHYPLTFGGEWHVDFRQLKRAITARTRAIALGNPSEPTGAALSREDLPRLEELCAEHRIALIADEDFADTAPSTAPALSVAGLSRSLAFHIAGLEGVCGLPEFGTAWTAVAGPDALTAPVLSRLQTMAPSAPAALLAVPALLARRERFLGPLRTRLTGNRARLASASLREAPWTLERGRGGRWAVLRIGDAENTEALCLSLLDDGVAVLPGSRHGLPRSGYLVLSLLPHPEVFGEGLSRLEVRLRAPLTA